MVVLERKGAFLPAKLQEGLSAAGIIVFGVTCSEDANGTVMSVQIICDDGTYEPSIDAVIAAYPNPVSPSDTATKNLVAAVAAVVNASDFAHAQANLKALVSPSSSLMAA